MKVFEAHLFILLIAYIGNSSCVIDTFYDAGKEIWRLYMMIDKINPKNRSDVTQIDAFFRGTNVNNQEIKNQIDTIFTELDRIERFMNTEKIKDSFKLSSSEVTLHMALDSIALAVKSIDESYEDFRAYMYDLNDKYGSQDAVRKLVEETILKVEGEIAWIRSMVIATSELEPAYNFLGHTIAKRSIQLYEKLCDGPQLVPEILVQLFKIIILAEIKANLVLIFANAHRYAQYQGWKMMNSFTMEIFEKQFASYVDVFSLSIDIINPLYLRACDPPDGRWIRDENFLELEGTFQTSIFGYHWSQCKFASCNAVARKLDRCEPENYDDRTSCSYKASQCAYLSAIKTCALKSGPYKFQYMNSTNLGKLGTNFECPKDNGYIIEDGTGWNANRAACVCNCNGDHNKISLSVMRSQLKFNNVIIGLRFIRKDGILYIQPREGRLGANGYISRSHQGWIPIPKHVEAHTIDSNNRIFFFDDLRLPPFYVLTGVKFNQVTRGNKRGFAIQIFGNEFNYETGEIKSRTKFHKYVKAADTTAGAGLVFHRQRSTYASAPHSPNPASIKYVSLERSELSSDFGQSTLPFFDAAPITTNPPSVLGGIGIFHKGTPGYAGFISLRTFSIDYKRYFINFQINEITGDRVLFNNSQNN